jgi:hypothetical protein
MNILSHSFPDYSHLPLPTTNTYKPVEVFVLGSTVLLKKYRVTCLGGLQIQK